MALAWLWWRAWFPLPPLSSPLFVWQAWHLEVIDLHSVWQVWHLEKSTFTLCSRRVTYGTGLALGALSSCCRRCCRGCLCGRRGIRKHRPPFCGAGVALGDIDLHFVWQARRFGTGLALVVRLVLVVTAAVCVAGLAFGSIDLHSVWQAWHLATSTFTLCGRRGASGTGLALVARLVPVVAVVVAGVCMVAGALDIDLHFVWQVW